MPQNEAQRQWYLRNREKHLANAAAYKAAHKEELRAKNKIYREAHADEARARLRAFQKNKPREVLRAYEERWLAKGDNLEKKREQNRRWYKQNKLRSRLLAHRKRARKFGAAGSYAVEQAVARAAMFGNKCWICCAPYEALDHVIPLSKGGTNWPANLRPICNRCNSSKGAKRPRQFLAERAKREKSHGI